MKDVRGLELVSVQKRGAKQAVHLRRTGESLYIPRLKIIEDPEGLKLMPPRRSYNYVDNTDSGSPN